MRLRPPRVFSALVIGLLLPGVALFGYGAVGAALHGQIAASAGLTVFIFVLLVLAFGSWRFEVVADSSGVVRRFVWSRRCDRNQLSVIRYAPRNPPLWRFIRRDGQQAFAISAYLFEPEEMAALASFLGTRLEP
ncbi:MAG: hypothetical protein ACYDAL_06660 [Candidatus Dormibacteraceae bacterium]